MQTEEFKKDNTTDDEMRRQNRQRCQLGSNTNSARFHGNCFAR